MRRVRIVYTIPNFDTAGSGLALLNLASRIDRGRFDPVIVCLHDRGPFAETVRKSGIPLLIHPYLTLQRPRWRFLAGIIRTALFFRSLRADIVFSYHYASDLSEVFAARLSGARFMYVKKNMGWTGPSWKQWRLKTWLAHAITVQNRDMIDLFFKGMDKARIISIGVDQSEYKPLMPDLQLREQLYLQKDEKVILCVANLVPKKGIGFLIEGFSRSSYLHTARLIIVGQHMTELWEEIQVLVSSLGVSGRVLFTGKRMDVKRFYTIADIFILPSTGDEGAPIVVQEAMASGVPVITTSVPGNREQLQELPDQIINPSDPEAIREAIDRMLSLGRDEKADILSRQLEIVERRYSLQNEVRMHERLYLETVSN